MTKKTVKWSLGLLFCFWHAGLVVVSGQQASSPNATGESSYASKDLKGMDLSRFSKSDFFIGGNISFGGIEGENDFIVANVDLIDVDKQNIKFSFIGGYFLNPLMSVGYRGKYSYVKNEQTLEADFLNISFNPLCN